MAAKFLLVLAMAAAALVGTAMGADYTVGAPKGLWDLRTDYAAWASSLTFRVGDRLVFQYSPTAHDVLEVNKADYDACNTNSAITTVQTGNDIVPLTAAGTRYFICGFPSHCTTGMKVQVNIVEAGAPAAGGAPSPVNTPAARGPAAAAAPSAKTPATPSSSPASVGAASLGGAVVAAAGLAMMLFN